MTIHRTLVSTRPAAVAVLTARGVAGTQRPEVEAVSGTAWPILALIFAAAAVVTWFAGVYLSRTTDALDARLKLGDAFGGMVLLAVAGSLPELAITVFAVLGHHFGLAAGNLIGGIAVQTIVIVLCDAFVRGDRPLSYLVGSLIPVLEASLVVVVMTVVLLGALLSPSTAVFGVSPASIAIVVLWLAGMYIINNVRKAPKWQANMPGSRPGRPHRRQPHAEVGHPYAKASLGLIVAIFAAGCVLTLVAGAVLEITGNALADRAGINGVVFGATVLALASGLPEISTGIAAVRLGDHQLAMGDVFGGNAFQVCLFLLADLLGGKPVLPSAGHQNSWLAGIGILLTIIYAAAVIGRPERRHVRLGIDSIAALAVFAIGMVGLIRVSP